MISEPIRRRFLPLFFAILLVDCALGAVAVLSPLAQTALVLFNLPSGFVYMLVCLSTRTPLHPIALATFYAMVAAQALIWANLIEGYRESRERQ